MKIRILLSAVCLVVLCSCKQATSPERKSVTHESDWGIYRLDLTSENVTLIHDDDRSIQGLSLDRRNRKLAFAQKAEGDADIHYEIMTIGVDGSGLTRLTRNGAMDVYPGFAPDGGRVVYLSMQSTLDLFMMDSNGGHQRLFYDSGTHDADVNWGSGGRIVFTRDSQLWTIREDGTDPRRLTDPPNAGEWGSANLPAGDYDPRFNSDGSRVVFERLVDAGQANGGYDIFKVDSAGFQESRLTHTACTQGLPEWSATDDRIVYIVAAVSGAGKYDMYMMDADGSNNRNITPDYFPPEFLCRQAVFSEEDAGVYFIGQWYP